MKKKKKMSYWRKIVEVFVQILLLPVAAYTTAFTSLVISIVMYWAGYPGYFLERYLLKKLKDFKPSEGYSYGTPSDKVVIHEKASGEYEAEVQHYSGKTFNPDMQIWVMAFFAVFLRIITLVLSIIALFVPPLCIKAKNNVGTFRSVVFDII